MESLYELIDENSFGLIPQWLRTAGPRAEVTVKIREGRVLRRCIDQDSAGLVFLFLDYETVEEIQECFRLSIVNGRWESMSALVEYMGARTGLFMDELVAALENAIPDHTHLVQVLLMHVRFSQDVVNAALCRAVRAEDMELVTLFIAHGADLRHDTSVVMVHAVASENEMMVSHLARLGAEVEPRGAELITMANEDAGTRMLPLVLSLGAANSPEGLAEARRLLRRADIDGTETWALGMFAGPGDVNWNTAASSTILDALTSKEATPSDDGNTGLQRFIMHYRELAFRVMDHPNFVLGEEYQDLLKDAAYENEMGIFMTLARKRGLPNVDWTFLRQCRPHILEFVLQNAYPDFDRWFNELDPTLPTLRVTKGRRLGMELRAMYEEYKEARKFALRLNPEDQDPRAKKRRAVADGRIGDETLLEVVNERGFGYMHD